jgi:hypothetical protein
MASPSLHGVPRMVPPLQRYYGTLRLPAVRLDPLRILHEPIPPFRPWFAPLGRGRPTGGLGVVGSGLPSGIAMETSGSLRFLGNPCGHCPCSSTPAGSGRLSGPWVSCLTRPPPVSRTKAPSGLYFRGSITRPLTSLSTLRRMGCTIATQDSLLAAGPALPGGIRTRRVSTKGFKVRVSSSFPRLCLTQGHHTEFARVRISYASSPCARRSHRPKRRRASLRAPVSSDRSAQSDSRLRGKARFARGDRNRPDG